MINNIQGPGGIPPKKPEFIIEKKQTKKPVEAQEVGDKIEISQVGKKLAEGIKVTDVNLEIVSKVKSYLKTTPDIRGEEITLAKKRVKEGFYKGKEAEIAEGLLKEQD